MKSAILKFWRDEEGATAIEYGLIAALIAVVAITAMTDIGKELNKVFESVKKALITGTGTGTGTGT